MNKILCIGEALIDMICTDKGMALSDGEHFLKKAGGAPMNVAAAIGALGGSVAVAAKVGDDPFGQHLVDVLNAFHVNTGHVIKDPQQFTTFAFVSLMENGERDFHFNRGADGQLSVEEIDSIHVKSFGIAHFGSATGFLPGPLQAAYHKMFFKALGENLFVSFDPNYRELLFGNNKEEFIRRSWALMEKADFFKVSNEEAFLLTRKSSIEEAAAVFTERTNAVFAITCGKEGSLLGHDKKMVQVPSIPVQVQDTTGAGDAFVGALLFQLSKFSKNEINSFGAKEWTALFSNANKAGARTCEYMGAMEAFKHLNDTIFSA
jgi:fructokinase